MYGAPPATVSDYVQCMRSFTADDPQHNNMQNAYIQQLVCVNAWLVGVVGGC